MGEPSNEVRRRVHVLKNRFGRFKGLREDPIQGFNLPQIASNSSMCS